MLLNEIKNYIDEAERKIRDYENICNDIYRSNYIDVLVEVRDENGNTTNERRQVSMYELLNNSTFTTSYIRNNIDGNVFNDTKNKIEQLNALKTKIESKDFDELDNKKNTILEKNNIKIAENEDEIRFLNIRTLAEKEYLNKNRDNEYLSEFRKLRATALEAQETLLDTELRNSDKKKTYLSSEDLKLNRYLLKNYDYNSIEKEYRDLKTREANIQIDYLSDTADRTILSLENEVKNLASSIKEDINKVIRNSSYLANDIERLANLDDSYISRKLYELRYINQFNESLGYKDLSEISNAVNFVKDKNNNLIKLSNEEKNSSDKNKIEAVAQTMSMSLESEYTFGKHDKNEAKRFRNFLNINFKDQKELKVSETKRNLSYVCKNYVNRVNYLKASKNKEQDKIQLKYIKSLLKQFNKKSPDNFDEIMKREIRFISDENLRKELYKKVTVKGEKIETKIIKDKKNEELKNEIISNIKNKVKGLFR